MNYEDVGRNLRRIRVENDLTQNELAEKAGVSQAHIAKIENEKVDPRVSTVKKILSVLRESGRKCKEMMTEEVVTANPEEKISEVVRKMKKYKISQLPVMEEDKVVGSITEEDITSNFREDLSSERVEKVMGESLPIVPETAMIKVVKPLLEQYQAILVGKKSELKGIISRSDLLKAI